MFLPQAFAPSRCPCQMHPLFPLTHPVTTDPPTQSQSGPYSRSASLLLCNLGKIDPWDTALPFHPHWAPRGWWLVFRCSREQGAWDGAFVLTIYQGLASCSRKY